MERLTQLVFSDLSAPKPYTESVEPDGVYQAADLQNVGDDLTKKLAAKGIPADEIAFIHDANTEARKAELFVKVRKGQVRVLIGSTQKMGRWGQMCRTNSLPCMTSTARGGCQRLDRLSGQFIVPLVSIKKFLQTY
jgi:hypothetical protein